MIPDRRRSLRPTQRESGGKRLYRRLLGAYPAHFKKRFAEEMVEVFERDRTQAGWRGRWFLALFWMRTLGHIVLFSLVEHFDHSLRHRGPASRRTGYLGGDSMWSNLTGDLRIALRQFRKNILTSAIAVAALALGLGASLCAFGILHGTLLRGLPFEEAHRLVHFERQDAERDLAVTPHDYLEWRQQQQSFQDLAAFVEALILLPRREGPPERLWGVFIEPQAFELLGAQPQLGRIFSRQEVEGGENVVVLSHRLWQRRFGGRSDVVGSHIPVEGRPAQVIGVMPAGFGFPIAEDFWVPLRLDLEGLERGAGRLDVFGRLREGISLQQAKSEFEVISQRLAEAYPESNRGVRARLQTFREEYVGREFSRFLYKILGAALLVLLVAGANVANLLLARMATRRREFTLRATLGAGPSRILRQVFLETGLLALASSLGGLALGWAGLGWFRREAVQAGVLPLPHGSDALFWWDVSLGWVAGAFLLLLSLLTAVLLALVPALPAWRSRPGAVLSERGRESSSGRLSRFSRGLVVAEVALTTALLVAAGLSLLSTWKVSRVEDNFSAEGIMTARVYLPLEAVGEPEERYPDEAARLDFWMRYLDSLDQQPRVGVAAAATRLPGETPPSSAICLAAAPPQNQEPCPTARVVTVSRDYFSLFGVEVREGRVFGPADSPASPAVAVVNESFARRHFGGASALGRRIGFQVDQGSPRWLEIVGVVPDLWRGRRAGDPNESVYLPLSQSAAHPMAEARGRWGLRFLQVALQGRGEPEGLADLMRRTLVAVDPGLPIRLESMPDVLQRRYGQFEVPGRFYQAFGALALFLACLGLYGVLSWSVRNRTSEIGVRMALGASGRRIQWLVLRQGGLQIVLGLGLGYVLAYFFAQGLDRFLYRTAASDPSAWLFSSFVIGLTGLLACWWPARQASRVDPLRAIRRD